MIRREPVPFFNPFDYHSVVHGRMLAIIVCKLLRLNSMKQRAVRYNQ